MTSVNLSIKKFVFSVVLGFVPFALFYILVIVLIREGFFDFLYSWPLVLSYLFFFLPTALMLGVSMIISMVLIVPLILRGYCTRRFLRLVCTSEAPKTGLEGLGEMRHVNVVDTSLFINALLFSVGLAMVPFIAFVLRGVEDKNVYPLDVLFLSVALFSWTLFSTYLVWLMLKFGAYRYAEGLSFREALQKLTLYTAEKKFGSTVFLGAVAMLGVHWIINWGAYIMKNPWLDDYHILVALFVPVTSLVVLAVVVGWALDVFTRRLFGETLGKFLFATFVVGAVFHPLLGLLSTFLFSWAMFGKAKDAAAAAAVSALSLFAVMLPGLIWTSVLLL